MGRVCLCVCLCGYVGEICDGRWHKYSKTSVSCLKIWVWVNCVAHSSHTTRKQTHLEMSVWFASSVFHFVCVSFHTCQCSRRWCRSPRLSCWSTRCLLDRKRKKTLHQCDNVSRHNCHSTQQYHTLTSSNDPYHNTTNHHIHTPNTTFNWMWHHSTHCQ